MLRFEPLRFTWVFPAHAGMSPELDRIAAALGSFPRTCGDEPDDWEAIVDNCEFSPHARG